MNFGLRIRIFMRILGNVSSALSLCIHPNCSVAGQGSLWDIPDRLFVVGGGVAPP